MKGGAGSKFVFDRAFSCTVAEPRLALLKLAVLRNGVQVNLSSDPTRALSEPPGLFHARKEMFISIAIVPYCCFLGRHFFSIKRHKNIALLCVALFFLPKFIFTTK